MTGGLKMIDCLAIQEFLSSDEAKKVLESEMLDMPYKIKNNDEADEVLGKIIWAQNQIAKNTEIVNSKKEKLMARLEAYENELNGSLRSYAEWQLTRLEAYARATMNNQKGAMKLFNGSVQLKKPTVKYDYKDAEATIKWLKEKGFGECIRVKEELDKVALKNKFKDTNDSMTAITYNGEQIPGVTLSLDKDPVFSISQPKTKSA